MITSEDFQALRPEWEALYVSTPGRTPFAHPAWHDLWLRHFGAGAFPVFLSVRVDDALVGVVALDMKRDGAITLGDPNVCDYAGMIVANGQEAVVAAGLLEWLTEDLTPRLDLWGLPADGPLTTAFAAVAEPMGWRIQQAAEAVSPRINLPQTFDAYLGALGKHARHEVRRKLRNFAAAGAVTFASATQPGEISAEFDAFLHLMRASRADKGEFLTPAMETFFRDLAATFAGLGMLRLSSLMLDGVTVAMTLAFENGETTYLYNSGYDPAFAHLAVGLLSKVYAIRDSIERGKRVFDLLRGDETYKRELGGQPVALVTLTLRQP